MRDIVKRPLISFYFKVGLCAKVTKNPHISLLLLGCICFSTTEHSSVDIFLISKNDFVIRLYYHLFQFYNYNKRVVRLIILYNLDSNWVYNWFEMSFIWCLSLYHKSLFRYCLLFIQTKMLQNALISKKNALISVEVYRKTIHWEYHLTSPCVCDVVECGSCLTMRSYSSFTYHCTIVNALILLLCCCC